MKVLFVCNQNQHRSLTAEGLFRDQFETRSAGLYKDTPISKDDMDWADIVIVMEDAQRSELSKRFPKEYLSKQIINIDIPDIYQYNQPELIEELKTKVNDILPVISQTAS